MGYHLVQRLHSWFFELGPSIVKFNEDESGEILMRMISHLQQKENMNEAQIPYEL